MCVRFTTRLESLSQKHCPFLCVLEIDWDMVFADDEKKANPAGFKFLQMAHAWKQNQATGGAGTASLASLPGFVKSTASAIPSNGHAETDGGNSPGGRSEEGSDASEGDE